MTNVSFSRERDFILTNKIIIKKEKEILEGYLLQNYNSI